MHVARCVYIYLLLTARHVEPARRAATSRHCHQGLIIGPSIWCMYAGCLQVRPELHTQHAAGLPEPDSMHVYADPA